MSDTPRNNGSGGLGTMGYGQYDNPAPRSAPSTTPRMDAAASRAHKSGKKGADFMEELAEQYRIEGRMLERESDHYRRMWEEAMDVIKRWHDRLP